MKKTMIVKWEDIRVGDRTLRYSCHRDPKNWNDVFRGIPLISTITGLSSEPSGCFEAVNQRGERSPRDGTYQIEREVANEEFVFCRLKDVRIDPELTFYPCTGEEVYTYAKRASEGDLPKHLICYSQDELEKYSKTGGWSQGICQKRFLKLYEFVVCQLKDTAFYEGLEFYNFGDKETAVEALARVVERAEVGSFCALGQQGIDRLRGGPGLLTWGFCSKHWLKLGTDPVVISFVSASEAVVQFIARFDAWNHADEHNLQSALSKTRLLEETQGKYHADKLLPCESDAWSKKLRVLQAEARERDRVQVTVDTSWWDD